MEKKGGETAQEMDSQSVDHGAVERLQTYQFSPEAEKRLVRKIDLMSVTLEIFRQESLNMTYADMYGFALGSFQSWSSHTFWHSWTNKPSAIAP